MACVFNQCPLFLFYVLNKILVSQTPSLWLPNNWHRRESCLLLSSSDSHIFLFLLIYIFITFPYLLFWLETALIFPSALDNVKAFSNTIKLSTTFSTMPIRQRMLSGHQIMFRFVNIAKPHSAKLYMQTKLISTTSGHVITYQGNNE